MQTGSPNTRDDDHYVILRVPFTASITTIQKSYRKLALICHPDRNPNDANATARFQKLVKAYETLVDPAKRAAYDDSRLIYQQPLRTWTSDAPASASPHSSFYGPHTEYAAFHDEALRQEATFADLNVRLSMLRVREVELTDQIATHEDRVKKLPTDLERLCALDAAEIPASSSRGWRASLSSLVVPPESKPGAGPVESERLRASRPQGVLSKGAMQLELGREINRLEPKMVELELLGTTRVTLSTERDSCQARRAELVWRREGEMRKAKEREAARRRGTATTNAAMRNGAAGRRAGDCKQFLHGDVHYGGWAKVEGTMCGRCRLLGRDDLAECLGCGIKECRRCRMERNARRQAQRG